MLYVECRALFMLASRPTLQSFTSKHGQCLSRSTILNRDYPTCNSRYLNLFLVAIQRIQFQSINIQRDIFLAYTTNVYIYYIGGRKRSGNKPVCELLGLHTESVDEFAAAQRIVNNIQTIVKQRITNFEIRQTRAISVLGGHTPYPRYRAGPRPPLY